MTKEEVIKLVNGAKEGSQKSFTALYTLFFRQINNLIYNLIKDRDQADDLTSETFTKAFMKIDKFQSEISFEMWLRTIATNCTIDFIRQNARRVDGPSLDDDTFFSKDNTYDASPEDEYITKENVELVKKNINKLGNRARQITSLRYIDGLSYKEIAEKVGLNIGTIKSYISKSTSKIKPI